MATTFPETERIEIRKTTAGSLPGWHARLDTGDGYGDWIPTPFLARAPEIMVLDTLGPLHPNADIYVAATS